VLALCARSRHCHRRYGAPSRCFNLVAFYKSSKHKASAASLTGFFASLSQLAHFDPSWVVRDVAVVLGGHQQNVFEEFQACDKDWRFWCTKQWRVSSGRCWVTNIRTAWVTNSCQQDRPQHNVTELIDYGNQTAIVTAYCNRKTNLRLGTSPFLRLSLYRKVFRRSTLSLNPSCNRQSDFFHFWISHIPVQHAEPVCEQLTKTKSRMNTERMTKISFTNLDSFTLHNFAEL